MVETVKLTHETRASSSPSPRASPPPGRCEWTKASRTLVVRDIPERARWFVEMARDFDVPAPR